MAKAASSSSERIEWQWKSNPDPWSKTQPAEWARYSDVQNMIIEDAFQSKQTTATLDGYYVDFKRGVQILHSDSNKQRPVQRLVRGKDAPQLREERFAFDPIAPKRSFGGEYGWVSPFIIEVRRHLGRKKAQLPSKDPSLTPCLLRRLHEVFWQRANYWAELKKRKRSHSCFWRKRARK